MTVTNEPGAKLGVTILIITILTAFVAFASAGAIAGIAAIILTPIGVCAFAGGMRGDGVVILPPREQPKRRCVDCGNPADEHDHFCATCGQVL